MRRSDRAHTSKRSLAALVLLLGCASSPEPAPAATSAAAVVVETASPTAPSETSAPTASAAPRGACEIYLEHYERCEPQLQPSIAAGDRRSARAERAFIEHMRMQPEGVTLADSCAAMLVELQKACP